MKKTLILAASGAAAGLLGGLLGIGGGTVIVPMLVLLLGKPQKKAQGISLVCACLIAVFALTRYAFHGHVSWSFGMFIIAGGIAGSFVGSWIVKRIDTRLLRLLFICLLFLTAANIIYSGVTGQGLFGLRPAPEANPALYALLVLLGVASGILSGLLGIGGGIVLVPCMLLLGVEQRTAQGISLLCIIPTSVTGVILQSRWGNVDLAAGLIAGAAAGVCSLAGSDLAALADYKALRIIFGIFLLIVTGLMIKTLVHKQGGS
ncbi:MAG: sulfite exporter TauE/SafE family protein [Abditibacteriota bacterium]|nr:sulfite exporter TauE/SafE family protein [Abditibacteriota bacterium]